MRFLIDLHYYAGIPFTGEDLKSNQRIVGLLPRYLSHGYTSMHALPAGLLLYFTVFLTKTVLEVHGVMEKLRMKFGVICCDLCPMYVKQNYSQYCISLAKESLPKVGWMSLLIWFSIYCAWSRDVSICQLSLHILPQKELNEVTFNCILGFDFVETLQTYMIEIFWYL